MNRKKNIAFALFGGPLIGGAEKRFARLFKHLSKTDFDNNYFLLITKERQESLFIQGINVSGENVYSFHRTDQRSFFGRRKRLKDDCKFLKEQIVNQKIDIVYSFWQGAFAAAKLKSEGLNFKFVLGYNDPSDSHSGTSFLKGSDSYVSSFEFADHVDFLSEERYRNIRKAGASPKSYSVSPCTFIDYCDIEVKEKRNTVAFAARFDKNKNPMLFLEVARKVLVENKDVQFYLLGKGSSFENKIESFIKQNKLNDHVHSFYTTELKKVLSENMIFLALQTDNNYPSQSLIEAMACENAVVATDVGETRDLIIPGTGILVKENADEIAKVVLDLLKSPEKCRILGKAASKHVRENHTIEKFALYFKSIVDKIS
ncbi:MAG: glycosyltransferase family 4 protein [Bacteroidota bacterium]